MLSSESDGSSEWDKEFIAAVRKKQGKGEKISENDRLEQMQKCLKQGADINAKNHYGNTALHIAVKRNYSTIVEFLRDNGAKDDIPNGNGETVMMLAEKLGQAEINLEESPKTDPKKESTEDNDEVAEIQGSEKTKTYPAGGTLTRAWPGIVYQLKHLAFTLHCALQQRDSYFFLATEMIDTGKLDDVVLQYKNSMGTQVGRFVQIKHRINESQVITAKHLIDKDGDFSIPNYFISWRAVRQNELFRNIECIHTILCTNIGLDVEDLKEKDIHCETTQEPDKSFELRSQKKPTAWYKFSTDQDLNKKLYDELRAKSDLRRLSSRMAECIYAKTPMRLEMDIFQHYHLALVEDVFDAKSKKFHDKFISNEDLSREVENFRKTFLDDCRRMANSSDADSTDESIWADIQARFEELYFLKNFGVAPRLESNPQLVNLEKFSNDFVNLLNTAKDYLVKIHTKASGSEEERKTAEEREERKHFLENITKLAGHVFVKHETKIKFSPRFLKNVKQASSDIDELRSMLRNRVGNNEQLEQFSFEMKNDYKTWSEAELLATNKLPEDYIGDEEISDFFREFTLATNQPNAGELGEIIGRKVTDDDQFNRLHADMIGSTFLTKIFEWFTDKGKRGTNVEYLSYKVCEELIQNMKHEINSGVTSGVNSVYSEKLKAYDVDFKFEMEVVKEFLITESSDSPSHRIMQLKADSDDTLLCVLRIHSTLQRIPKYTKQDGFIFIQLDVLLLPTIMNHVKAAFESPGYPDLLLVDFGSKCEVNRDFRRLWDMLLLIVERNVKKKIILITHKNDDSLIQFATMFQTVKEEMDKSGFYHLTDESANKLLRKSVIEFQGQEIRTSFRKLFDVNDSDEIGMDELQNLVDIIDSNTLMKLIRGEKIRIGDACEGLGDIEDHYIDRRIVQHVIIKEDVFKDHKDQEIPDVLAISGTSNEPFNIATQMPDIFSMVQNMVPDPYDFDDMEDNIPKSSISGKTFGKSFVNEPVDLTMCTILDSTREEEQFKVLCEKHVGRNIHWLNKDSGKYIWQQSIGRIEYLVKHRDARESDNDIIKSVLNSKKSAKYLFENELAVHNKPVIISADAGMGKSTMLTHLAWTLRRTRPDMIVFRVDLNHHITANLMKTSRYNLSSVDEAMAFLVNELLGCKTILDCKVFERILKQQNVVLIFDGFDEISPSHEDTVIKLLEAVAKHGIEKLFVSTRPHTRQNLEKKLNTFFFEIEPLSKKDQEDFLNKYWKTKFEEKGKERESLSKHSGMGSHQLRAGLSEEDLERTENRVKKYTQAILAKLADSIDDQRNRFTGIPLHTKLVAEICQDHRIENFDSCEQFINSKADQPTLPRKIDLIYLYKHFVEKIFGIYFNKINGHPTADLVKEAKEELFHTFVNSHQELALVALFDVEQVKELLPNPQNSCNHNIVVERKGIISEMIKGRPHFAHRTYAEYFAAKFLADMLQRGNLNQSVQKILVADILLSKNHRITRTFMDLFLINKPDAVLEGESWKSNLTKHRSERNETMFHVAAAEGNQEIIRLFLNCPGTDSRYRKIVIDLKDNFDRTAMFRAVQYGHLNVMELLRDHASVDMKSQDVLGRTLLHVTLRSGRLDVLKFILNKGADVNFDLSDGCTLLHYAAAQSHLDIIKYLLTKGARVNAVATNGSTPLHYAVVPGRLDVVRYLIQNGANVNSRLKLAPSILHIACIFCELHLVEYLLENGANRHGRWYEGITPLHVAAHVGRLDIVGYLLDKGAPVNCSDKKGITPLHIAASKGHLDVVKYLLNKRADVSSTNNIGSTPLHLAAKQGQTDIMTILLNAEADVSSTDNIGCTPLHVAAMKGQTDVMMILLNAGADVSSTDRIGSTPLHLAASRSQLDAVKYLLEMGASPYIKMYNGWTPLQLAFNEDAWGEVMRYLIQWMVHKLQRKEMQEAAVRSYCQK